MPGLDIQHLSVEFQTEDGILQAVRDISFALKPGHTLAIVGESGSGKSVTGRAILGILEGNACVTTAGYWIRLYLYSVCIAHLSHHSGLLVTRCI